MKDKDKIIQIYQDAIKKQKKVIEYLKNKNHIDSLKSKKTIKENKIKIIEDKISKLESIEPIKILDNIEVYTPDQIEKILFIKKFTQDKYRRLKDNNIKKLYYLQLGRKIFYKKDDIKNWIKLNTK